MNKWKIIKYITLSILIMFLIYVMWLFGMCINDNYPYDMWGATISNWAEGFLANLIVRLYIIGIPILLVIILLIVSIIKTKVK